MTVGALTVVVVHDGLKAGETWYQLIQECHLLATILYNSVMNYLAVFVSVQSLWCLHGLLFTSFYTFISLPVTNIDTMRDRVFCIGNMYAI